VRDRPLEICFPDVESQKLFCHEHRLKAEFGAALARLIACRLTLLNVASHLGLLPAAGPIDLRSETGEVSVFSVALAQDCRLHFRALDFEKRKNGAIKLNTVRHLEIIGVVQPPAKKVRKR
jgi:hypothetical protein